MKKKKKKYCNFNALEADFPKNQTSVLVLGEKIFAWINSIYIKTQLIFTAYICMYNIQ